MQDEIGAQPAQPTGDALALSNLASLRYRLLPFPILLVVEYAVIVPTYLLTLLGPGGIVQTQQGWGAALLWTGVMGALALLPLLVRGRLATPAQRGAFVLLDLALTSWAVWLARLSDTSTFLFFLTLGAALILDRRLGRAAGLACVAIVFAEAYVRTGTRDATPYVNLLSWLAGLLFTAMTIVLYTREQAARARSDQLLAELRIAHAQLRGYAEQVRELATVQERNRLAQELHDSVTQTLFSASLIADALPRLWLKQPDAAPRRLDELRQLTRGALAEMRMLLLELRPSALTQVPFGDLLRQLATATAGRAQLPVDVTVTGDGDLPPEVQVALYRIAQETLNNLVKYANAEHAWLQARLEPRAVEICIGDDGQGFHPGTVPPGHLGLGIMRERAQAIGATLHVESTPGVGTSVTVRWSGSA